MRPSGIPADERGSADVAAPDPPDEAPGLLFRQDQRHAIQLSSLDAFGGNTNAVVVRLFGGRQRGTRCCFDGRR